MLRATLSGLTDARILMELKETLRERPESSGEQERVEGSKKVDDHADQRLVDYLAPQVRTNGAWKNTRQER